MLCVLVLLLIIQKSNARAIRQANEAMIKSDEMFIKKKPKEDELLLLTQQLLREKQSNVLVYKRESAMHASLTLEIKPSDLKYYEDILRQYHCNIEAGSHEIWKIDCEVNNERDIE